MIIEFGLRYEKHKVEMHVECYEVRVSKSLDEEAYLGIEFDDGAGLRSYIVDQDGLEEITYIIRGR